MKVAVTGATGFVGRHVLAELERRDISPVLVCRPAAAIPAGFSRHSVVRLDIAHADDSYYTSMGRPDVVIHLAWGGLPNYHALRHFASELPVQYRFVERLVTAGLENIVISGTCLEYGLAAGALAEEFIPQPVTAYGFAKDALRRQLQFLQASVKFNLVWARLFYLYGQGQAKSSLYAQLEGAAGRGDESFDMSGGAQLRDYLPVQTAATHLVSLALSRGNIGVVNVCSGQPISVREMVERWMQQNGWAISLNLGRYPYPEYEPMAFWGNAGKLRALQRPADVV